jgi:cytochrome c553
MKRRWFKMAVFLAVGGFVAASSGLVPIKASSGHWAITTWFLQFSKRRSVATHTLGLTAPPLDNPDLVLQGAGHYETGCGPCHGSPDLPSPRIPQQMTPHPPYLPQVIPEWEPDELFYIVKHGVKFTGMPAWPAQQRADEVWAMVAFLLKLPELDAESYRELVDGKSSADTENAPRTVTKSCGRCHGRDAKTIPRLEGQSLTYLLAALQSFARGERHSGIMEPIAAGLSLGEMQELARYYGNLEASPPPPPASELTPAIERGKAIASQGMPRQRVPSCVDCHGPGASRRNPIYPILGGQHADYLVLQLDLFKKRLRGGSAYAHLMHPVAAGLTPEQMQDVALYYASLTSGLSR